MVNDGHPPADFDHGAHSEPTELGFDSIAVRAGQIRTSEQEHAEAIFPTSSFVFTSAEQAADRFAGREPGNVYSRFTNPTVQMFEQRIAALEGGERGLATASGMSAILTLCLGVLKHGDHIVASHSLFGTTVNLFANVLPRFGIETSFVTAADPTAWRDAIRQDTRLIFAETPTNPLNEVIDIAFLGELAHEANALLAIDNCFCTPALQRPLAHGADVVVHSATKYLDGQGRAVGGALVASDALISDHLFPIVRTCGPSMSPFNAWIFLKGLETLSLRMTRHCASAAEVAAWLANQSQVRRVYHLSQSAESDVAIAAKQQKADGAIVAFDLEGGKSAAYQLINRLSLFSITANLGDAKSTVTHPATTTHGRLSQAQRDQMGIGDGLVRLSIGLEDSVDLIGDLAKALR